MVDTMTTLSQAVAFPQASAGPPLMMNPGFSMWQATQTGIKRIPIPVMQKNVFGLMNSRELFKVRGVCSDWSD